MFLSGIARMPALINATSSWISSFANGSGEVKHRLCDFAEANWTMFAVRPAGILGLMAASFWGTACASNPSPSPSSPAQHSTEPRQATQPTQSQQLCAQARANWAMRLKDPEGRLPQGVSRDWVDEYLKALQDCK